MGFVPENLQFPLWIFTGGTLGVPFPLFRRPANLSAFWGCVQFPPIFSGWISPSWQWRVAATERVIALTTRENSQPFFGSPATWGSTGVAWKTSFFHLFQCLVMFFFAMLTSSSTWWTFWFNFFKKKTPLKINMEPKDHPSAKENHLNQTFIIRFKMLIFHSESVQNICVKTIAISIILYRGIELIAWTSTGAIGKLWWEMWTRFFFCVFLGKGYTLPKSKNSQSKMVDGFFSEAMLVSGRVLHFKSATLGKLFGKVDVNISIAKRYTQKFRKKELAQNFSDLFGTNRGRNPASVEVGSEYPSLYDGVMASFFLVEFWAESTVCRGSCGGLFEWSRSHSTSTIWPWGFSWIFS